MQGSKHILLSKSMTISNFLYGFNLLKIRKNNTKKNTGFKHGQFTRRMDRKGAIEV